jgi:Flp pilus assembly protein TadG
VQFFRVNRRWSLARADGVSLDCEGAGPLKKGLSGFLAAKHATAAVEFAMIAPVVATLLFGVVGFSMLFSIYNAVEQIAAEAARAGIAGLTSTEQSQLAVSYVNGAIASYGFLDPTKVTVAPTSLSNTFEVTISYDMSGSFIFGLGGVFANMSPMIVRSATVQTSGF